MSNIRQFAINNLFCRNILLVPCAMFFISLYSKPVLDDTKNQQTTKKSCKISQGAKSWAGLVIFWFCCKVESAVVHVLF